jgi:hypothetical protein
MANGLDDLTFANFSWRVSAAPAPTDRAAFAPGGSTTSDGRTMAFPAL